MPPSDPNPTRRYRRRVLVGGLLLAAVVAGVGAPLYVRGIERDLERRVPDELADAGITGVAASFSGQEGTLSCDTPLADPEDVLDLVHEIRGVQVVELDRSCRVAQAGEGDGGEDATATTAPGTSVREGTGSTVGAPFESVIDVVDGTPQLSILSTLLAEAELTTELRGAGPFTLLAPTDGAFEALDADVLGRLRQDAGVLARVLRHHAVAGRLASADLAAGGLVALDGVPIDLALDGDAATGAPVVVAEGDVAAGNGVVHLIDQVLVPATLGVDTVPDERLVVITRDAEGLVLGGAVASEAQRLILIAAAWEVMSQEHVAVDLAVDPASPLTDDAVTALTDLVRLMPAHLASGTAAHDGTIPSITGSYVDDDSRAAIEGVVQSTGAAAELRPRPAATEEDATALDSTLAALVAATAVQFEVGGAELAPDAAPLLDRVAGAVLQRGGLVVTVEGHSDSDGDPQRNLELSEARASAVRDALVARGVPEDEITAVGVGDSQLVVVDGVEDKAASRRVEFSVALQDG